MKSYLGNRYYVWGNRYVTIVSKCFVVDVLKFTLKTSVTFT